MGKFMTYSPPVMFVHALRAEVSGHFTCHLLHAPSQQHGSSEVAGTLVRGGMQCRQLRLQLLKGECDDHHPTKLRNVIAAAFMQSSLSFSLSLFLFLPPGRNFRLRMELHARILFSQHFQMSSVSRSIFRFAIRFGTHSLHMSTCMTRLPLISTQFKSASYERLIKDDGRWGSGIPMQNCLCKIDF
jgi:hypothetical protein